MLQGIYIIIQNLIKISLVICILYSQLSFAALEQQFQKKFITIADVHFDPFLGCESKKICPKIQALNSAPYQKWEEIFKKKEFQTQVKYYQDTNYDLLKTTINQLKIVNNKEHPQFVLILGDFLGHKFRSKYKESTGNQSLEAYQQFVKKTLQFITYEIEIAFPEIDVYPVIGNNDSYTGNYSVVPDGAFLRDMDDMGSIFIKNNQNQKDFHRTFKNCGYYEITLSNKNKLIVLNTVLFAERARTSAMKKAAINQLEWLHQRLAFAYKQHEHVMLAFHIPIGIDVFATVKNKLNLTYFWKPIYSKQFENDMQEYASIISVILLGHIHIDTFQFVTIKKLFNIPIHFTPSISPIFGNNPAFKLFTYDITTLKIKSIDTYTDLLNSSIPQWRLDYMPFTVGF